MASRLSTNERSFILGALNAEERVDGRRPFDMRRLHIAIGNNDDDGTAEVQLGETRVMAVVTAHVVQPHRSRPNEGTLSIYSDMSPMADPAFEAQYSRAAAADVAVVLDRIVERGLRESRALDTESLCILSGKAVWALRLDLAVLDNGGNVIDAANVAALAALLAFRRPECTVGADGRDIVIHPPAMREPVPLIVHHLPIALTFAFFGDGASVSTVIDPSLKEEAVMGGRMTVNVNTHGDLCGIIKAGGVGVSQNEVLRCLRIASVKAAEITEKIRASVEAFNTERAMRKIRRHRVPQGNPLRIDAAEAMKTEIKEEDKEEDEDVSEEEKQEKELASGGEKDLFLGGPSKWDPFSEGLSKSGGAGGTEALAGDDVAAHLKVDAMALNDEEEAIGGKSESLKDSGSDEIRKTETKQNVVSKDPKSLEDAVKPHALKKRRKKKHAK